MKQVHRKSQHENPDDEAARVARLTAGLGPRKPLEPGVTATEALEIAEQGIPESTETSDEPKSIEPKTVVVTETRVAATKTVTFDEPPSEDPMDDVYKDEETEEDTANTPFLCSEKAVHYDVVELGEGRQSRIYALTHKKTGEKLLLFESQPEKDHALKLHANTLQELKGRRHFFQIKDHQESCQDQPAYMLCENPEAIPLETLLASSPSLEDRMSIVRQTLEAFSTLHERAGKLHMDPFPKQLYAKRQEDGSLEVYLSDLGDVEDLHGTLNSCQNSLLQETENETALFNTSFASADKRRRIPYDQQAEVEVVARILTWILTGNEPIDGVRATLEEFREEQDEVSEELDDMIVKITVAAARNREKRYKTMSEFSRALSKSENNRLSGGKSLGLRIDFDKLSSPEAVAHLRKSLGNVDRSELDPRVAKAFEELEEMEEEMISELRNIGSRRDEIANNGNLESREIAITDGDEVIMRYLQFPSIEIQQAAFRASHLHGNWLIIDRVSESLKRACRQALYSGMESPEKKEWKSLWMKYISTMYSIGCFGSVIISEKNPEGIKPQKELDIVLTILDQKYLPLGTSLRQIEGMLGCLLNAQELLPGGTLEKWKDHYVQYACLNPEFLSRSSLKCITSYLSTLIGQGGEEGNRVAKELAHSMFRLRSTSKNSNGGGFISYTLRVFDGPTLEKDPSAETIIGAYEDSWLYPSVTPDVIIKAYEEGVIPRDWTLTLLSCLNKPLTSSEYDKLLPDCSLPDEEIDQERLSFCLERAQRDIDDEDDKWAKRYIPNAFLRAHYDLLLRRKIATAEEEGNQAQVQEMKAELLELLGEINYAIVCFEDAYVDEAFDLLGDGERLSHEQCIRLFQVSLNAIKKDESLARTRIRFARHEINRGEKVDIRNSRYDTLLGNCTERISKDEQSYLLKARRSKGRYVISTDYTEQGYRSVESIFELLSAISKNSHEETRGVFEKAAQNLLSSFKNMHPEVFDTDHVSGPLRQLQLKKYKNHPRQFGIDVWIVKNPQKAINIREKIRGL
jgi:hypothetical protein